MFKVYNNYYCIEVYRNHKHLTGCTETTTYARSYPFLKSYHIILLVIFSTSIIIIIYYVMFILTLTEMWCVYI